MTLPYDPVSLALAAVAIVLVLAAWRARTSWPRLAIALVVAAGALLRLDSAWQDSLHRWDEQFHALVARNLIEDPLTPTLYRNPAIPYDYTDWMANHVWLHKPPLALWSMAASMRAFGINAVAMRMPSVLWSSAAILLTFFIGLRLFDSRIALLAAIFQAFNGFLIALASGRRVADHVDTALIVFFELAIWLAVAGGSTMRNMLLAGGAVGLAFLAKSLPALLALPVLLAVLIRTRRWQAALGLTALAAFAAVLVAVPWNVYTWVRWPVEAEYELVHTAMHVTTAVEGPSDGPLMYVRDLPRFFGELMPVSLALAAYWYISRRKPDAMPVLAAWIVTPYVLFSMAATRMPAFIMISAPALMLIHAYVWCELRDRLPGMSGPGRTAMVAFLVLMTVSPVRSLFEPAGALERRDRHSPAREAIQRLEAQIGPGDAVVFDMPGAIEAMFYSSYTIYEQMPTDAQRRAIAESGRRLVIYRR